MPGDNQYATKGKPLKLWDSLGAVDSSARVMQYANKMQKRSRVSFFLVHSFAIFLSIAHSSHYKIQEI